MDATITHWYKYVLYAVLIYVSIGQVVKHYQKYYGIGINMTESDVKGIYLYKPIDYPIKMKDKVMATITNQRWVYERGYLTENQYLLKTVAATYPYHLTTINKIIYACDINFASKQCLKLGECLSFDRKNKPMPCMQWINERIPPHWYYLQSLKTPNSLDSRYLGLFSESNIKHKAELFLEWEK
jgi:type IV secretory pathway protease TraF